MELGALNPKSATGQPNTRSSATHVRPIGRRVVPLSRFRIVRADISPVLPVTSSSSWLQRFANSS